MWLITGIVVCAIVFLMSLFGWALIIGALDEMEEVED
jgi:hypothetical protein